MNISITKYIQTKYIYTAVSSVFLILCVFFSKEVTNGILDGLNACLNTIIPALFPYIMLSIFFTSCVFPKSIKKRLNAPLSFLFGISGNCVQSAVAGLVGGYNIASKSAVFLNENSKNDLTQSQILAIFFTNPGLSFCINIVGIGIYNSKSLGFKFYISSVLSSLICAFIYERFHSNKAEYIKDKNTEFLLPQALSNTVEATSRTIINICSWIISYYAIIPIIRKILLIKPLLTVINIFGEVSSGIVYTNSSVYLTDFVLNFGGICIFLQQIPDIIKLKINPLKFLLARIIISSVGTLIYYIIELLFPSEIFTISNFSSVKVFSHSAVGSCALMFLCFVFLNSVTKRKNQQTNIKNDNIRTCHI